MYISIDIKLWFIPLLELSCSLYIRSFINLALQIKYSLILFGTLTNSECIALKYKSIFMHDLLRVFLYLL